MSNQSNASVYNAEPIRSRASASIEDYTYFRDQAHCTWCWAAVGVGICRFFLPHRISPNGHLTQVKVVDICKPEGQERYEGNNLGATLKALFESGELSYEFQGCNSSLTAAGQEALRDRIIRAIDQRNPVPCSVLLQDLNSNLSTEHAVTIIGYQYINSDLYFEIYDPLKDRIDTNRYHILAEDIFTQAGSSSSVGTPAATYELSGDMILIQALFRR